MYTLIAAPPACTMPRSAITCSGALRAMIRPNCPGPTTTQPCPTPPGAYAERKILVFNEAGSKPIATVDIDSQGLYVIDLAPAKYTVDIKKVGIDRSGDVPKVVEIRANAVTKLDIAIDTGIR